MSELVVLDGSGMVQAYQTEHYHKCVMAGDISSVKYRLAAALEQLGYDLIDDDETILRGRRGPRGWATSWSSADVLEYASTLTIRLKPLSEHSLRATFDYTVKHPSLSMSEKEILTREAEAIAAIATTRGVDIACSACGNASNDDSRFCRRCGTPLTRQFPELEILRLASEIRAGHTSVATAGVFSIISLMLLVWAFAALYVSGAAFTKGVTVLLALGLAGYLTAGISIFFAWNRSRRAINGKPAAEALPEPPRFVPATLRPTLPEQPFSVIDNTTKLLDDEPSAAKTGDFR